MAAVKYDDLEDALMLLTTAGPCEAEAYVSLDTGAVYWVSGLLDGDEQDLPADLETSDRYVAIPDKNELNLGQRLVMRFVAQHLPDEYERVLQIFSRRGAYGRYKDLLDERELLQAWFDFEAQAQRDALTDWAEMQGLEVVGERPPL